MARIARSDLVQFGLLDEAVEGTLETGTAVPVVLTTGITPDFTSNILQDNTISGAGEVIDAQTNLRGLNLQTPAMLRYNDCRVLIAPALRDVFATAAAVTGTSDINVVLAGTHLDGSTGTQITVGDTSSFDDFITYAGSTAARGGAEGLLMRISGFADSKNNWHRRIKAVWKDGTTSYIDIDDGWVGGSVGFFGEPMAATTLESPTISVGRAVRNRITGSGVVSKTALWQFTDMVNNGKFGGGFGLVANDYGVSWSGKEGVTIDVGWIGHGAVTLTDTDPTGAGFTDSNLYTDMLHAADRLQYFAIVNAVQPIVLSSLNLNSFNFTLAGNSSAIDDVSGTSNVTGVSRGSHVPSGSIDYYLADDERSELLAQLGAEGTAQKGEVSYLFADRAGNEIAEACLWNEFGQTGPIPGSIGSNVGGSIEFMGKRLTDTSRSFVHQEIAAP